jgi:hypothetical protein
MPRHLPQPHLDLWSDQPADELIQVDGNGQRLPNAAEVAPHQPFIAIPARAEALQQLLGASIDENRHLTFASTSPVIVLCLSVSLRADTTSARSPDGPHSGGSRHTAWAAMDGLAAQADARSTRRCQTNRG